MKDRQRYNKGNRRDAILHTDQRELGKGREKEKVRERQRERESKGKTERKRNKSTISKLYRENRKKHIF